MLDKTVLKFIQFINFSFIGVATFSIQTALTVILTEFAGLAYYISYALSLIVGWFANFLLNMNITFKARGDISGMLEKYVAVVICIVITNWLLVIFFVETLGLHYILSIVIAAIILATANFTLQKLWVFKKK